ncbi:MAG: tripartite tricarboxylate transporter substrate binding protein [Burkholderiales bacterium]|nr:tripartite tricarboxylate transporter substrate binding protein [Burkholderiales bacterium]
MRIIAVVLWLCASLGANAQGYPNRPVKIIVPFTPAGSPDIVARAMADGAGEVLAQPVVIENVPGAGGNVGTARAAKAPADGYTLVQCTIGTCSINGSLYASPGFDAQKDFAPVFLTGGVMNVFTVNHGFPGRTMQDLVAWAKANPGKLTYGSSGVGASNHLAPEWLAFLTGISMVHVPYKGSGPAIIDIVGGQIMMFNDNEPSILPQIKAGKVRALAVTGAQRSRNLVEVPTMEEEGFKGFVVEPWFGFMVPKGTPAPVIERLNAAFNNALANARVRKRLEETGLRLVGGPPERLGEQMRVETERWARVIKANNIRAE